MIDGAEINLQYLEDQRVRAAFHDARLHFALNCASAGCPPLPNEAFTPERLDARLDRETQRFCNEARNVRVDPAARRVVLSQIFEWYAQDFVETERSRGRADGDRITFINRYRAEGDQIPRGYTVDFVDYDWTLNAQRAPGQAPSSSRATGRCDLETLAAGVGSAGRLGERTCGERPEAHQEARRAARRRGRAPNAYRARGVFPRNDRLSSPTSPLALHDRMALPGVGRRGGDLNMAGALRLARRSASDAQQDAVTRFERRRGDTEPR